MEKVKDPLLYKILRPIAKWLFIILYRPKIIGKKNIPKKEGIILCCNHQSNLDCVMLMSTTKRCIHFLAKEELFKGKFGFLFKRLGLIPVKRKTKDGNAIPRGLSYLEKDKVIGIFPEGTFNKSDDVILPFKIGAVKMSHGGNKQIVPCVIKGEYKIFRRRVRITIFPPIQYKTDNLDEANEKLMNFYRDKLTDSEV